MNSHRSTSLTRTRTLSRSATPHELAASAVTLLQNAADPSKDLVLLLAQIGGDDDGDRLSDRFRLRVPKQLLRGPVPRRDHTIEVLRNDDVIRRINNRGEPRPKVYYVGLIQQNLPLKGRLVHTTS